jgi:glycosyltransferase involved in cell wall biosynthesis
VAYDPLRSGLIGLLVARLAGARFAPEVNGVYDSYANYLEGGSRPMLACKRWLYPRLVGFTLRRSDGIKTLFQTQLKAYRDAIRTPVVEHFFDYVNLEPFADLGEEKTVLFVGFPFRLKGVDLLIEAFKSISPRHPEWKLKILGWFPDDRELKARMGGHPAIFHQPPVLPSEMPGHMGRCGIFVLPSRTEAMGRVLLEAMACCKPRIGADIEGIPTVIEDGKDGLLFKAGDAGDLAAKLDRLMGDSDLRKQLGVAGRLRSVSEFNADRYFRRLFEFYGRVLRQVQVQDPSRAPQPQGVLDAA